LLQRKDFIFIGKIVKSLGLKGFIKVISQTDFNERYESLDSVYLFNEKDNELIKNKYTGFLKFEIEDRVLLKDHNRIKFNGYNNRSDVGDLKNCYLVIDKSEKTKLSRGNYYYFDLINAKIFSDKKEVGLVKAVENYGGDDLLLIELNESKKKILLPLRKQFINKIDIDNKIIDVTLIEGFIE
jgi:16S rRNA processing protein RimM